MNTDRLIFGNESLKFVEKLVKDSTSA